MRSRALPSSTEASAQFLIDMLASKTLFVVGAGASHEVGLPAGPDLKNEIAHKLDIKFDSGGNQLISGDSAISDALSHYARMAGGDFNQFRRAAVQISDAMPVHVSIDEYIHTQGTDEKVQFCGKLAIAQSILEAEKKSRLYPRGHLPSPNYESIKESWYIPFIRILGEKRNTGDIERVFDNVSVITFNYDRCIEHFSYHAIQTYFTVGTEQAQSLMDTFSVYHPYGKVGALPWQARGGTAFGDSPRYPQQLLPLVDQIKTFTERVEDEEAIADIRRAVSEAELVVFLGFAFHPQNMALLKPTSKANAKMVLSTGYDLSATDCKVYETAHIRTPRLRG